MYRVCCMRRANKENAASFMLRSLLLWTKMMFFSRERGGKCDRLSNAEDFAGVLVRPACKKRQSVRNDAGLEGFSHTHSCLLRCKILHFEVIDFNL